jgi:hypothetical protein
LPNRGYQTITLKTSVYAKLVDAYEQKKRDLVMEDIKSYTAYAQKILEKGIEQDVLEGRFEIIERFENTVVVMDFYRRKRVEVHINKKDRLYCELDGAGNCDHVGFVLSDPAVIKRAKELGVKLRKTLS